MVLHYNKHLYYLLSFLFSKESLPKENLIEKLEEYKMMVSFYRVLESVSIIKCQCTSVAYDIYIPNQICLNTEVSQTSDCRITWCIGLMVGQSTSLFASQLVIQPVC